MLSQIAPWPRGQSSIPPFHHRSGLSCESRAALFRCRWRLGNDGGHTIWVDVEGQERQRLIARVSPLVDKAEWLVDQRARPSLLCFASHRVSSRSRDNIVESRSRAMVWRVRGHACRESDPRKIEIITARPQVGNRCRRAVNLFHDSRCYFGRLIQVCRRNKKEMQQGRWFAASCLQRHLLPTSDKEAFAAADRLHPAIDRDFG